MHGGIAANVAKLPGKRKSSGEWMGLCQESERARRAELIANEPLEGRYSLPADCSLVWLL
jgi:hypothetical protein